MRDVVDVRTLRRRVVVVDDGRRLEERVGTREERGESWFGSEVEDGGED